MLGGAMSRRHGAGAAATRQNAEQPHQQIPSTARPARTRQQEDHERDGPPDVHADDTGRRPIRSDSQAGNHGIGPNRTIQAAIHHVVRRARTPMTARQRAGREVDHAEAHGRRRRGRGEIDPPMRRSLRTVRKAARRWPCSDGGAAVDPTSRARQEDRKRDQTAGLQDDDDPAPADRGASDRRRRDRRRPSRRAPRDVGADRKSPARLRKLLGAAAHCPPGAARTADARGDVHRR